MLEVVRTGLDKESVLDLSLEDNCVKKDGLSILAIKDAILYVGCCEVIRLSRWRTKMVFF